MEAQTQMMVACVRDGSNEKVSERDEMDPESPNTGSSTHASPEKQNLLDSFEPPTKRNRTSPGNSSSEHGSSPSCSFGCSESWTEKHFEIAMTSLKNWKNESNDQIHHLEQIIAKKDESHAEEVKKLKQEIEDLGSTVGELIGKLNTSERKSADSQGKQICCGCNKTVDSLFFCTAACHNEHMK